MIAGIAVDDWKLPIFRKRLEEAGFSYEDAGALTHGTTMLRVETKNMRALEIVVRECQAECRKESGA